MRYYSIVISDPNTGEVLKPKSTKGLGGDATYTSFVGGKTLPGAQNVELNVPVTVLDQPLGAAYVRVWGISLEEIAQANDLRGKAIQVFAGMQAGLPLAKPAQAGLILQGYINQSWGNWIENAMTLDMIVYAGLGLVTDPKNLIHSWKKGTKLSDAIKNTLSTAFPGYTADVNISDKLVLSEDDVGFYQTIGQYASYVYGVSRSIVGGDYQGVRVVVKEKTLSVFDGTTQKEPYLIAFEDMIGQPSWIDQLTVQFKTTMRADLAVGDYVKFPPAAVTTTPGGAQPLGSTLRSSSVFQGAFQINQMNHFGDFRQPDAASWNTTFNVFSVQAGQ